MPAAPNANSSRGRARTLARPRPPAASSATCQITNRAAELSAPWATGPPSAKIDRCPKISMTRPAKATVTPADIQSSRESPTVRAEAWVRWPTSAAQTQPTARQAGTAAVGCVSPPALSATTKAAAAVTPQAASNRALTLTGARRLSNGDIVSIVTVCK